MRFRDRNMKFFHTMTLVSRQRNRVEMLRNKEGAWVEDVVELKRIAVSYYEKLFISEERRWSAHFWCLLIH